MTDYINKSEFKTRIGKMYYLWKKKAGRIVILYLGDSKQDFQVFLNKIKEIYKGPQLISFIPKKSTEIEKAINDYLNGNIKEIDFEVEFLLGTKFQKSVWSKLISVPYGKTISYKELSNISGYKEAWRAAGSALNRNPAMLVIPCHRVIKSNGTVGRFAGGPELKEFLLNLEKKDDST